MRMRFLKEVFSLDWCRTGFFALSFTAGFIRLMTTVGYHPTGTPLYITAALIVTWSVGKFYKIYN